jgi:hypothetical protein
MTRMDEAAWDSSADPLWPEMGVHSALPSSTEVSTELRDSTRAQDDDGALPSGTETGKAQSISGADSSSIVRSGPRTEIPQEEPQSDMRLPQMGSTVTADHGEQGGTQQGQLKKQVGYS